jgi:Concanavalin A-like lectin/glucanases superfamily
MTRVVRQLFTALRFSFIALSLTCRVHGSAPEPRPRVESGRALVPPVLDGRCDDAEYPAATAVVLEDSAGRPGGRARVVHDGLDLFVCVDGLDPAAAARATVRIEQSGGAASSFPPGAEQRIDLAQVGGFARSVGLSITVDGARWPPPAGRATTGELVLGPVYRDAPAGSVFVDGRRGFLAIADAAALHPRDELTMEAWVRPAAGACGSLWSGGADDLYLGLCGTFRFGLAGRRDAQATRQPLDAGWHHVAVTVDRDGRRIQYVDGEPVVQRGRAPEASELHDAEAQGRAEPTRQPATPGAGAAGLRIGSDATAPPGEDRFRGNVRELRIWSRARTLEELRATAFVALAGTEPGLVALWPLTHDLHDRVAGRDAGIVGTAALAREAPTAVAFPARGPTPPGYHYPPYEPLPAWTPQLVVQPGPAVQLDGHCDEPSYVGADELRLEPDRQRTVAVLLRDDALYVCARPVPGRAGGADGLTVVVGAQLPLVIRLAADGALKVARPDGTSVANLGIEGRAATAPALVAGQEGIGVVPTPWWSGELRIPLQALAGVRPGAALVLGAMVDGSVGLDTLSPADRANLDPRAEVRISARWPARLDPASPQTWGQIATATAAGRIGSARGGVALAAPPRAPAREARLFTRSVPWPQPSPSVLDFQTRCPTIKGTATIYVAGIKIKTIDLPDDLPYAFDRNLKWPMVDPGRHPMVTASGTLAAIELSTLDSPFIHTSHDLDMMLWTDWDDAWLVLGSLGEDRGIVAETENGGLAFPARPLSGDHVTVRGRWIFDCGHAPKTEIHPIPYFASDHKAVVPAGFGTNQEVQLARVRLTASPGAFSYTLEPFSFDLELPRDTTATWPRSGGSERFVRVHHADGATVAWHAEPGSTQLTVTVTPAPGATEAYVELLAGYLDSPRTPDEVTGSRLERGPDSTMIEKTFTTYTVELEGIDVLDDLRGKLETTAGVRGSGKWHLDAIINDQWHGLLINQEVSTGGSLSLAGLPPVPTLPGPLTLTVTGFVNNDPFDGLHLSRAAMTTYHLGDLKALCCDTTRSFTPPEGGPWRLRYHVKLGGDVTLAYPDRAWWTPRLADNDQISAALGVLPVDPGGAPQVTTREAYITEPPLQHDNVVLDPDVDGYNFTLDDFADVQIAPLAPPLVLEQSPMYDYEGYTTMPPELQAIVGYGRNFLTVHTTTGNAGEVPYALRITTRYKKLDPDWGTAHDRPDDGRAVDLRTPDPRARVTRTTTGLDVPSEMRALTMPWAWQHLAGEPHYYRVSFPPPTPRPAGHKTCEYDTAASLNVDAAFTTATLLGDPHPDRGLAERFPTGQVVVLVENHAPIIMGKRAVYRFTATFSDAVWLTPGQCATVRALVGSLHVVKTPFPVGGSLADLLRYALGQAGPGGSPGGLPPGPGPVSLGPLGNSWLVQVDEHARFETLITGARDRAVEPRLYDSDGVLISLGTSDPRGGGARLVVEGLKPGATYTLQLAPAFDVPRDRASVVPLSFGR